MFYLVVLVFVAEETGLEGVAMKDAHMVDSRSDSVFFIFGNAVSAVVISKSLFEFVHYEGQDTHIFLFVVTREEKRV